MKLLIKASKADDACQIDSKRTITSYYLSYVVNHYINCDAFLIVKWHNGTRFNATMKRLIYMNGRKDLFEQKI